MPTRQEVMMAHDLLTKVWKMNELFFACTFFMQEIDPITGDPFINRIATGPPDNPGPDIFRSATLPELKELAIQRLTVIDKIRTTVDKFLTKVDLMSLNTGLEDYKFTLTDPNSDLNNLASVRTRAGQDIIGSANKGQLKSRGQAFTYTPKVERKTILPEPARSLNIANDILDTLSFELQQIDPHVGGPKAFAFAFLQELIPARLQAAFTANSNRDADIDNIINHILANFQAAADLADMAALGAYIDANLPKLPLIRRHWAL